MPDNKTVDFQKERSRRQFKRIIKKLRVLIAVMLVICIFAVYLAAVGETRRSNIMDSFYSVPKTIGESRGFPYNEDELSLDKVMKIGDKPLIISSGGVVVLSQNADKLNELHLDWGDTRVNSLNGRALVYSNTQGSAYLISRTGVLNEFREENPVVTGCVGSNGSVALSYSSESVQSTVKVYTPRNKVDFEWECSKEYVSALSLSDNGKKVFLSAVGVEDAEIYTRLVLFKTDKTEPQFDTHLEGTAVLKTFLTSHNKIVAIGDNKTVVLNRKGAVTTEITYADDALYYIGNDSKGNILLCYKEFGGAKIKAVYIPSYGRSYKEFELEYMPESADIKGSKVAFAVNNTVDIFTPSGTKKKTYECKHNVGTVLISNTGIYTLENGSVYNY